jgi:general secretion pathway protein C
MTSAAKWTDFASLDGAKILATANRLLPNWVTLVLVILIAWLLARIAWSLIPAPAAGDSVEAPVGTTTPASVTESTGGSVQAIADAHIFGVAAPDDEAGESAQPAVEEMENLRDTRLTNLSLKGTIADTSADRAVAIIADGSNDEKVYTIGSSVANGATLHAVYADRVVLNENGVLTNLKLPREYMATTESFARRNTTATSRAANTQSIQSVVANNVSQLADVIRPTPYFVNGQQQGYRVYPGRNRQQFAALGLRPGDLIMDIDGQSLSDPTQAMKIFQTLDSADQVSVTVERNGQPQVIVLSTSQLDLGDENNQ